MITYLGESVWPDGPGCPELFSIGVGLGRIPRFCGHTREWYPVLAHVLSVAEILPPQAALQGLLHDAPETCLADVPTPWKTQAARKREHMLLRRIYLANGVEWPITHEIQELVDWADATMLGAEAHIIGHPKASEYWEIPTQENAAIVVKYLELALSFMNAQVGGKVYEEAFEHYRGKLDEHRRIMDNTSQPANVG